MEHVDINSAKHFGVNFAGPTLGAILGVLIGLIVACFIGYTSRCVILGMIIGTAFGDGGAICASVTKEWCDDVFYGHWCWWDLFFDVLGLFAGNIIPIIVVITIWNNLC